MRIKINYTTSYAYALPASHVVQLLRVQPRATEDQHILSWRVDVDADGSLRSGFDVYGNITHIFYAERAIEALTLQVTGEVATTDSFGVIRGSVEPLPPILYRRTTPLSEADGELRGFAEQCRAASGDAFNGLDTLHQISNAIHTTMQFDADATGTGTDAVTAFALRRGVCQDFTHIFLGAARHLGHPARYVSGHFVHADGAAVQPASHAWAEAFVEGQGWIGFDPTNGRSTDDSYIRVAVGLDALAAGPVRGARRGGGVESLSVSVSATESGRAPSQEQ